MFRISAGASRTLIFTVSLGAAAILAIVPAAAASAATTIDGPVPLDNAASFSVLAGSELTNTGASVLDGRAGVSPGTSITGFPPGIASTLESNTNLAIAGETSVTQAYNIAASLSPTKSGMDELGGLVLGPGVYASASTLQVTGDLTLKGNAKSVWVFQAGSGLTTASGSRILFSGGASACNVVWQVGSSATLGQGSTFEGTILALASISAVQGTTVQGRLLAKVAVSLDTTRVKAPTGCTTTSGGSTVATTPTITSGTPDVAAVDKAYSFPITASGTPSPTFSISSGALPTGLKLNATTGMISGTPTTLGSANFTVRARNSAVSSTARALAISVTADGTSLALTGVNPAPGLIGGIGLAGSGLALFFVARRRRPLHRG
jgi:hypothetical protein